MTALPIGSFVELIEDYRDSTYLTPKGSRGTVVYIHADQSMLVTFRDPAFLPRGSHRCDVTHEQIKLIP